ncbi:MAG: hypothetical protein ABI775_15755, partial [Pseudonocardiales bacterium]
MHFAESMSGHYLDPIRRGALQPFVDVGHPTIAQIMFRRGTRELDPDRVKGRVQICCVAYDTTPISVPAPWHHMPVAPARLRYRIFCAGECVVPLRSGVDLRVFRKPDAFHVVYASDTTQNHPGKPGHYCFILTHDWNIDVRERPLPARGGGRRRARQPGRLVAGVQDPQRHLTLCGQRGGLDHDLLEVERPHGVEPE